MNRACLLIVDDSDSVRRAVRSVVEQRLGVGKVLEACDGREALGILQREEVSIILSDWEMPELTGEELLYEVRQNKQWRTLPFVMMTEHRTKDFMMTAIQLGVTNYIVKPFTAGELEDKIKTSWNSASRRSAERYFSLPHHQLVVKTSGRSFPAQVVNMSRTGALIRLNYEEEIRLFHEYDLALEFEKVGGRDTWVINPIRATAVRLEADGLFHPSTMMCNLALYFNPATMDAKIEEALDGLLKWLRSQSPDVIE